MALADSGAAAWARPAATKAAMLTGPAHFEMVIINLLDGPRSMRIAKIKHFPPLTVPIVAQESALALGSHCWGSGLWPEQESGVVPQASLSGIVTLVSKAD
jgi:hypothetical protein